MLEKDIVTYLQFYINTPMYFLDVWGCLSLLHSI